METYRASIYTSRRYLTSGTLCAVLIRITGDAGISTHWEQLGKSSLFRSNLKRGSVEVVEVQHDGKRIGVPVVVSLKLSGRWLDSWLCDKVLIHYEGNEFEFPVYDWVDENEMKVVQGEAKLPHQESSALVRDLRKGEIVSNRVKFQWYPAPMCEDDLGWGVNRFMNAKNFLELPKIFLRTFDHMKSIGGSGLEVAYNTGTNLLRGLFKSIKTLDDYKKLYKHLGYKDPIFIEDWMKDEEMGRQVLTGISPLAFERCHAIPDYCDVTDHDVRGLLPSDLTLDDEIKAGRIYIVDYTFVKNIERNKNPKTGEPLVCAECVGLFYASKEDGLFRPIAIQLIPGDRASVFTPRDSHYDWLLTKMFFRATMSSMHEWHYHFLSTHGVSETFCIATLRSFPRCHPLYKLLRPHLVTVPTINTDARTVIMPHGSLANRSNSLNSLSALRHCYKTFNILQLDIPALLKSKGTDDKNLLPNYHYRDDAILLWQVIEKYVGKVLKIYYQSDQDILDDHELQEWAFDLAHEGFGWQDKNTRGFPDQITTVSELVHLCTIIIFTSSSQHASVNFGQMETYQFVPNSPGCMTLPVHKKGEATLERIIATLPDITTSSIFISFSYSLSCFNDDEIYLGQIPEQLFNETAVANIQQEFQDDLTSVEKQIMERNAGLKYPYVYLLPRKIPISIAI